MEAFKKRILTRDISNLKLDIDRYTLMKDTKPIRDRLNDLEERLKYKQVQLNNLTDG